MKNLHNKITNALLNKKGEMLIETIISIMLFTFLIVGVTMIITSATNGIRTTQRLADTAQETANIMLSTAASPTAPHPDAVISDISVSITLEVSETTPPLATPPDDVTISHGGKLISQNSMIYFYTQP